MIDSIIRLLKINESAQGSATFKKTSPYYFSQCNSLGYSFFTRAEAGLLGAKEVISLAPFSKVVGHQAEQDLQGATDQTYTAVVICVFTISSFVEIDDMYLLPLLRDTTSLPQLPKQCVERFAKMHKGVG
jgi:hypothetical protein